jgi:hypothetical protein
MFDQGAEAFHRSPTPADLEQGADHPANLVAKKSVANKLQVESLAAALHSHSENVSNGGFASGVRNGERGPIVFSDQEPGGSGELQAVLDLSYPGRTEFDPRQRR